MPPRSLQVKTKPISSAGPRCWAPCRCQTRHPQRPGRGLEPWPRSSSRRSTHGGRGRTPWPEVRNLIRDKAPGAMSVTWLCLAALRPCCLPTFCAPASSLKGGQNGAAEEWGLWRKDRPHRRWCGKRFAKGGRQGRAPPRSWLGSVPQGELGGSLSTPLGTCQARPELSVKVSLMVERGRVPLTRATELPGRSRAGASGDHPGSRASPEQTCRQQLPTARGGAEGRGPGMRALLLSGDTCAPLRAQEKDG